VVNYRTDEPQGDGPADAPTTTGDDGHPVCCRFMHHGNYTDSMGSPGHCQATHPRSGRFDAFRHVRREMARKLLDPGGGPRKNVTLQLVRFFLV